MSISKVEEPTISIIIPVYNGETFLDRTIESCLSQTVSNIEIIVVDDNSSDRSLDIAKRIALGYPIIRVIHNDTNIGLCKNANKGIKASNGEYILVLGQDDLLPPNHIEEMIKQFDSDVAMVHCNCSLINENDEVYEKCEWKNRELFAKDFMVENAISSCGAMIRKQSVQLVGGYPEFDKYPHYGEWYLWIKLLRVGRIVPCDRTTALYRRHENNITNTFYDKDKLIGLNTYWNICRKLAIKEANIPSIFKIKYYIRVLLSTLKARLRYVLK